MKMMKEDMDGRREDCRCFSSMTYLKHCSFISYLHPVYIEGLMTGDDDLDSFSWNHVLISSFQAPISIHDRDISSNLNQHNTTTFDSNQQHDMYKSSTADSYERLLKKTSRMIQSIISLYDTPPQATEQKSSSSSSSFSSSLSTTTADHDDYNLRVDDLVAEDLDHHCDWNILPYILQSCRQSL